MTIQHPFARGQFAILGAFQAWNPLTALVLPGNMRWTLDPAYKPETTQNPNSRNRPQIEIGCKQLGWQPFTFNSLGVAFKAAYPVQITTDELTEGTALLLSWEMGRALTAYVDALLGLSDILAKWEIPSDGSVKPFDTGTGRQSWTTILSVVLSFSMTRDQYLTTTFTK